MEELNQHLTRHEETAPYAELNGKLDALDEKLTAYQEELKTFTDPAVIDAPVIEETETEIEAPPVDESKEEEYEDSERQRKGLLYALAAVVIGILAFVGFRAYRHNRHPGHRGIDYGDEVSGEPYNLFGQAFDEYGLPR